MGAAAEELDLALVVLHRRVRFVEVTEAVHRKIVAEQYDEVAFDRRVHETFTELSMKRASINGIVDAAARMLAEPVVLEDLSHQAVAASSAIPAELLGDWERRSRRSPGGGTKAEPWVPKWMAFPPTAYTSRGGVGSVKATARVAFELSTPADAGPAEQGGAADDDEAPLAA